MTLQPSSRKQLRSIAGVVSASLLLVVAFAGSSRSQPSAQTAPAPAPKTVEFVGQWGTRGKAPGQLDEPMGIAVGDAGRVFIADRGTGRVQKFEADGTPLLAFGDASVRSAAGIAVDSGGAIYVADPNRGRISIFFPEGELLRRIPVPPQRGFAGAYDFSIDDHGAIYVPEPDRGRIQVFSPGGRMERSWKVVSESGHAARPTMAVAGPDGFIYVGDARSGRIVKFTPEGKQVTRWGLRSDGEMSLLGLAVSPQYVFALRGANPRLIGWTHSGRQVLASNLEGRLGAAPGDRAAIAWGPGDELLVLDASTRRVLRFRIHLTQDQ